jgi:hypothetical protein
MFVLLRRMWLSSTVYSGFGNTQFSIDKLFIIDNSLYTVQSKDFEPLCPVWDKINFRM